MRHYENLDEALADLREPSNVEIEGKFEMGGRHFYISGKTLTTDSDEHTKEMYKFWVEEVPVKVDTKQQVFFPDR